MAKRAVRIHLMLGLCLKRIVKLRYLMLLGKGKLVYEVFIHRLGCLHSCACWSAQLGLSRCVQLQSCG